MMNFDEDELIDKAMAGRLTADEQRLWQALLAERPELEADIEIGRALRNMPAPPVVSSNFTALVLQEINKSLARTPAAGWRSWFTVPRLARAAGAAVVVGGLVLGISYQRRAGEERKEMAASVKSFAGGLQVVANKSDAQPEAVVRLLQDFDAIRELPANNDVDIVLLSALRSE